MNGNGRVIANTLFYHLNNGANIQHLLGCKYTSLKIPSEKCKRAIERGMVQMRESRRKEGIRAKWM